MSSNALKKLNEHVSYVESWVREVACNIPMYVASPASFLLAGIYLKLVHIAELLSPGDNYFRIDHFTLTANAKAKRIVERDSVNNRVRRVVIWVDSGLGGPVPTLRLSTQASASNSVGLQLIPSTWNEIGRIPPDTELFLSSSVDIGLNVAIEG